MEPGSRAADAHLAPAYMQIWLQQGGRDLLLAKQRQVWAELPLSGERLSAHPDLSWTLQ